eukprot:gene8555-33988_t
MNDEGSWSYVQGLDVASDGIMVLEAYPLAHALPPAKQPNTGPECFNTQPHSIEIDVTLSAMCRQGSFTLRAVSLGQAVPLRISSEAAFQHSVPLLSPSKTGPSHNLSPSETGPSHDLSPSETGPSHDLPPSETGPSCDLGAASDSTNSESPVQLIVTLDVSHFKNIMSASLLWLEVWNGHILSQSIPLLTFPACMEGMVLELGGLRLPQQQELVERQGPSTELLTEIGTWMQMAKRVHKAVADSVDVQAANDSTVAIEMSSLPLAMALRQGTLRVGTALLNFLVIQGWAHTAHMILHELLEECQLGMTEVEEFFLQETEITLLHAAVYSKRKYMVFLVLEWASAYGSQIGWHTECQSGWTPM